ncbi:MAG: PadR family transcriptional regulator [Chlorobi bacterium]|nr:PadR family transcriptional regulator [Chlorobiota bacterium]
MNVEKINAQMRKGVLELCVLAVISDREVYTSDIISSLKEAELLVVEGTVYPLLTRLKNEGLLKYKWQESTSGPPRKYFSLTDKGKSVFKTMYENWEKLNQSINRILKNKKI